MEVETELETQETPMVRQVMVELTDEEIKDRGKRLAEALDDLYILMEERSVKVKEYKTKIDDLNALIQSLALRIRNGKEIRDVETTEIPDKALLRITIVRKDTGEMVGTRPMSAQEISHLNRLPY